MKKFLIAAGAVCSLALLAGCGGTKTTDVPTDTTPIVDATTPTTSNATKVDATKEQCLQMVTFGMRAAVAQMSGDTATATKVAQEASDYEDQMRNENVEYETACEKYMTDSTFIQDVQKRMQEK